MAAEFDEINVGYRDANKSAIYYEAVLDAAIEMVSTLCIASILWFAGLRRVGDHTITFALLVTFTQYIRQFFEPVSLLSQRYTLLQSAMAGAERIFELLDEKDVVPGTLPAAECCPAGAVRRGDRARARRLRVQARRRRSCATSASRRGRASGSRSSARRAPARRRSRACSFVSTSRRAAPCACSARTCAATSRTRSGGSSRSCRRTSSCSRGRCSRTSRSRDDAPDRARAEEALRRIGALELFQRRDRAGTESGLDARVDERGQNFSAGERQLLAFARAIYRDAPLLVLDEATASVDSDTEARLQRALEAVIEGRTALVIAHRLSTIRAADRIVAFHKGRVVEVGSARRAHGARGRVRAPLPHAVRPRAGRRRRAPPRRGSRVRARRLTRRAARGSDVPVSWPPAVVGVTWGVESRLSRRAFSPR